MDFATLAAAQNYVDKTAQSLGAVKGAPCTIKSITEGENGSTVVFSWTGADGTEQTASTFLPRGPQGIPGEKGDPGAPGKDGSGIDTEARKQIAELSEEIGKIKENGGGATPDWNQNDETAPDYIKNRPFYEIEERKTVYPITELEAGDYEGAWMANIPEYLDVKIGDEVVINFNGVEYKRITLDSFGTPYVGNPVYAGAPENMDTGEPFCIMFFLENVAVYVNNTVTTCKVGIFHSKTEVKKIDSKFIDGAMPMVVNLGVEYLNADGTEMKFSMDKTFRKIKNAVKSGRFVYLLDATDENGNFYNIYPLTDVSVNQIEFCAYSAKYGGAVGYTIDQSETVEWI